MNEFVCNYAIARFRPYRETGEFVNVGVVLMCPQLDFFGFLIEHHKYKRITDFFPELDLEVYKAGLGGLTKELASLAGARAGNAPQMLFGGEALARNAVFKELVRPREAIFHFGEIATTLAADPAAKLQELFDFHIKRQFAHDREYQEIIMRKRLNEFLSKTNLARFYRQDQRVGDDSYNVILPFVHFDGALAAKAIKPLHLDKDSPTEVCRHGDAWVSCVRRLRRINQLPKDFMFAVKHPAQGAKTQAAAREICAALEDLETQTVSFSDTAAIESFARC